MKLVKIILVSFLLTACQTAQNPIHEKHAPNCRPEVAKQFLRWNKAKGKELKGLTIRRQKEMNLFLEGCHYDKKDIQ